ncbi:MAG: hypothetical protein RRX92_01250 [Lachnospiraceae bacterium]
MAVTENTQLKQCKLKFANCYQLNNGVSNVPIFVEKFMNRITYGKVSLSGMGHLAGQFMLFSVLLSGLGICKGIIDGDTIGELLPYYIISLFGLYVYFSINSLVDIPTKKQILKTNLVDYFENHRNNQLSVLEESQEITAVPQTEKGLEATSSFFSKSEALELDELLKEFLIN